VTAQSTASCASDPCNRLPHVTSCVIALLLLTGGSGPVMAQTAFFGEPHVVGRSIDVAARQLASSVSEIKNGFYPDLSTMTTGAGWLSIGPGYRQWLGGDRLFLDASTAVSWRAYKIAQGRVELPNLARSRLAVGTQIRWQNLTQVTYFGAGPSAVASDRSEYRLKSTNLVGYATLRARRWLALTGRAGWLGRPSIGAPSGIFRRGNPATGHVFPEDPVFALPRQPTYRYGELSLTADTRDHFSRATRGGLYRVVWAGYSDRDSSVFSFRRSELEGAHFVPLAASRLVLALHGWLVTSTTSSGHVVPFYFLPAVGGHNSLRAYQDFRFHDRNLLVVNAETRVALWPHLDAAVFVDAGNVAARTRNLDVARSSVGVGLRMHRTRSTFARIDVAHGHEGWRLVFRANDPLHVSRAALRTAPVPFVP
jgi:hypothetical protein